MQIATPNATRRMFAAVIRAFASGKLTNRQYDDVVYTLMFSKQWDEACDDIFWMIWCFYCDFRTHRLTDKGQVFDPRNPHLDEDRAFYARCILFLRNTRFSKPGTRHDELLPFASAAEFAAARQTNTFLYGKPSI